jgi:signal transduction histidine kinase
MPDIERLSLDQAVCKAVDQHEQRTGTRVARCIEPLPEPSNPEVKTCLYRFVQEALNNAYRHADAKGQRLSVERSKDRFEIVVEDSGPGIVETNAGANQDVRLGLIGMRRRIEALGGRFFIEAKADCGTRLRAAFSIEGWHHA